MTCLECGRWVPPCPETGYDADDYCSVACEQTAMNSEDFCLGCGRQWTEEGPVQDYCDLCIDEQTKPEGKTMNETPRQRRTAASILDEIGARYAKEQRILFDAEAEVLLSKARLEVIKDIMNDCEKNGGSDE